MFMPLVALLLGPTPQPDVMRVRTLLVEVNQSLQRKDSNDSRQLEGACVAALTAGVMEALPQLLGPNPPRENGPALNGLILEFVQAEMRGLPAPGVASVRRRDALEALARKVTSQRTAVALISAWLDLPMDDSWEGPSPFDAPAEETGAPRPAQLRTEPNPGLDLVIDTPKSALVADTGGPGSGNGQIDGGEWIRLKLELRNRSPRAWFSTSSVLETDSGCLVVPARRPELLGELPPGGSGTLETWVYVSERCSGEPRRLQLRLWDTHHGGAAGTVEHVYLPATEVPHPSLLNPRLDTDAWGYSDGSARVRVSPDQKFEFSSGVSLAGVKVASVVTDMALPQALAGLFEKPPSLLKAALLEDRPGQFSPVDDLDLKVVKQEAFDRVLEAAETSRGWVGGLSGGTLWVAVDSTVEVTLPGQPRPPAPAPVERAPAAPRPPPAPEAVAALASKHISLVARRKPPLLPNGLDAAEGYEATFDQKAFTEAYRTLVAPPARVDSPALAPALAGPSGTTYRFRNVFGLPLVPGTSRPPLTPPKVEQPVVAQPTPPSEPALATTPGTLAFEVVSGAGRRSAGLLPGRLGAFNGESSAWLPVATGRAVVGDTWVGIFGAHFEGMYFVANDQEPTSFISGAVQVGNGYQFRVTEGSTVRPWLAAELGVRTFGEAASHTFVNGGAGLTYRAELPSGPNDSSRTGFLLEASWFPVSYSAGFDTLFGLTGPRLAAGVSFF